MKNAVLLLVVILAATVSGCEGVKAFSGVVVSAENNKPLAGAEINVLNNMGDSTITDSTGRFMLKTGLISMMFGGPKFKFEVRKEDFNPQVIKVKYGIDN